MNEPAPERIETSLAARAAVLAGGFVVLLWLVEILDRLLPGRWESGGVRPRDIDGLLGILTAPVLHAGWSHLLSNSIALLLLGFVLGLSGARTWFTVTAIVWVVAGLGVWLIGGSGTNHLGASLIVFGWLSFLLARGFFARNLVQIAVGVLVFAVYGGLLWGVLPGRPGVSWEGHLAGALGGLLAAWLLAPAKDVEARPAEGR